MSIEEAVLLALRQNRTIKSGFLDRVIQKYNLRVAEDKFFPDLDLTGSAGRTDSTITDTDITNSVLDSMAGKAVVTEKLPTGGVLTFSWEENLEKGVVQGTDNEKTGTAGGEITFTQPLLKGAGIDVNMASIKTARLTEKQNILVLKNSVMDTISSVILAYRGFLKARQQTDVTMASLERAKKLLEKSRQKVSAGHMASVEIVQVEADIASREFEHESAINDMDNARLNLLKLLAMDKHINIEPVPEKKISPLKPDLQVCINAALSDNPEYNRLKIDVQKAEINLMLAKNNRLWDVSLNSSYSFSQSDDRLFGKNSDDKTWNVALSLNIPLYGDLTRKQTVLEAETSLKKAELQLKESGNNIEIEIKDLVQKVKSAWKLYELAGRSLRLTEQKLEIEQEKMNAGLSSNFQIVTFQNDLFEAQNNEISAAINYRNALTELDKAIGTTLDTWQINLDENAFQDNANFP